MSLKTNEDGSLVIAPRNLTLGQSRFSRIDDGSASLAINGLLAGASTSIWDGTGVLDVGADWAISGIGSETVGANHAGTNGWDSGVAAKDGVTVFNNGSMIDVAGSYDVLEFWFNPQAFPIGSFLSLQWLNAVDSKIGIQLNVNDYVTNFDLGVWQKVSVPIADFSLPGNVQKLQIQYRKVAGQHFYLDEFALLQSGGGGPYIFRVEAPDATTVYDVSMAVILLSGLSSGWTDTSFANLSALSNGLLLRFVSKSTGEVFWSLNSKDNTDLFGRFHPQDEITFANDVTLVGFMIKPGKASIRITNDHVLELVVRDDLSGLGSARAFVHYGIEVVG